MPCPIRRLLATLLVVIMCTGMMPVQAESTQVQSAQRTIRLYPQHMQGAYVNQCNELCYIPLKKTEKNSTMCTSGCMIWAFVHAIQWARQERYGSTECLRLVQEFIAADPAPWEVQYVVDENYHNVVRNHDLDILSTPPTTEAELIDFFQVSGSVICNMGGHCAVAIGYSYFDYNGDSVDDMMLHMVDSALWSSARKQEIYHFKTKKRITFTEDCAGEFWFPQTTYATMDRLAIIPAAPSSDEVSSTDEVH